MEYPTSSRRFIFQVASPTGSERKMENSDMLARARFLVKDVTSLPTIPAVVTRTLELLSRSEVELDEIVDLVLTDQVLAARVIRMVNSPLYRPALEIHSVKHALIYLGLSKIRELVLSCTLIGLFKKQDGPINIRTFWEHSFGVGIVARVIAEMAHYPHSEKAYLSGIVHDIGKVFLNHYMKEDFQKVLELIQKEPQKLIDAEARLIGTTHCHIGICIASTWNFPEDYCEAILSHHTPEEAVLNPLLTAIVNLADLFCSVRGLGFGSGEWVSFELAKEEGWRILEKFSPDKLSFDAEKFCFELDDKIPEIRNLVKSIY